MEEGGACFGEDVTAVCQLTVDVQPPPALAHESRTHEELRVDRHGLPVAHEDPRGHGGEAVPGRNEAACLVDRGGDKPAVHEPGRSLMPLVEGEPGLVLGQSFGRRLQQADPVWGAAAAPARRIVVRRDYGFACHTFSNVPKRSSWS